ncbi:MAG TPA: DinB family protein [Ohtaekwangia sp.]|uniref:DinB family protein n=1 Tax=Ohtaekwangia sp. TaxID=2066019 RepID=UPI002F92432B
MKKLAWFDRQFTFGLPSGMLPFYLERLSGTAWRMEAKVKGIADEILSERWNDKWSVKQNIGHLAEVDEVASQRIDQMLQGAEVMAPAVFEPRDYNAMSVQDVIAYFREGRLKHLAKYSSLRDEDLLVSSIHPRLKQRMTPIDLAFFDAEHDDHHLLMISEILAQHT